MFTPSSKAIDVSIGSFPFPDGSGVAMILSPFVKVGE